MTFWPLPWPWISSFKQLNFILYILDPTAYLKKIKIKVIVPNWQANNPKGIYLVGSIHPDGQWSKNRVFCEVFTHLFQWKVVIVRSKIIIRAINMRSLDILVKGSYNSIKLMKLITISKCTSVMEILYVRNCTSVTKKLCN